MRKFVGAVAILAVSFGIAMAEELSGRITKIDGNKVTFEEKKKGDKDYQPAKTLETAPDVKVSKMDKKDKVAVAGGLKAEELQNLGKGKGAKINVEGGKVTEIILSGGKKKDAK